MLPKNLTANQADLVAHSRRSFAWFQLVFGLIFTVGALMGGLFGVIRPALQMRAARHWTQTPCVITESVVKRGIGKSSTKRPSKPNYTLVLAYQYQFQGQSYRGTTYSFDVTQLTGLKESSQAAKSLPVGSTTVCWVNPAYPTEAVLKREAQQPRLLLLVPVLLSVAGVAIVLNAVKTLRAAD